MKKRHQTSFRTSSLAHEAKLEEFEFPSAGLFSVGVSRDTGNVELTFIPAFDRRAVLIVFLPKGSLGPLLHELRNILSVIGRGFQSTAAEMQPLTLLGASMAAEAPVEESIVVLDFDGFESRIKIPNAQVAAELVSVMQDCAKHAPPAG